MAHETYTGVVDTDVKKPQDKKKTIKKTGDDD